MTFFFLAGMALAFLISSVVGLGGSLIAVPLAVMTFGPKAGVAMASLLLLGNNIVKVVAYRQAIPWKGSASLALITMVATFLGANLLVALPDRWVVAAVIVSLLCSLVAEIQAGRLSTLPQQDTDSRRALRPHGFKRGSLYALAAGLSSGVSGTSGPLKALAIRQWVNDPATFAGSASLVSLVGDFTKTAVFAQAALYPTSQLPLLAPLLPMMLLIPFVGRAINRQLGSGVFSALFWLVIVGYASRLLAG